MEITIYQKEGNRYGPLENFLDLYYKGRMKYFASDLLREGLAPTDITEAIRRAMIVCKTSEMEVRMHFAPIYTQGNGRLIRDCKLSRLGISLVLLNANVHVLAVAKYQLKLLRQNFPENKFA